jgi:hypothetical protein
VASGITLIPDISQNTGICGWLGGISWGQDIAAADPNPNVAGVTLTDDAGVNTLTDDAGTNTLQSG